MQAWILKSIRASIKASRPPATDHRIHVRRLWYFLGRMDAADTFLLLCSILLCSYLLPTIMEMEMIKHMGVWAGCILFGDAAGCSFLSLGLGLRKTGGWLYALLTVCEGSLYAAHIVPVHLLLWLVDIGPTLAIMGLIAFCFFNSRLDRIINTV